MQTKTVTKTVSHKKRVLHKTVQMTLVFVLLNLFFIPRLQLQPSDPDFFYHLFYSRYLAQHHLWWTGELPQMVVLGWNRFFADKEFLFHILTRLAYSTGGELMVRFLPLFLLFYMSWMIINLSNLLVRRQCESSSEKDQKSRVISYLICGFLSIAPFLLSGRLGYRFSLLRPHDLAIPLLITNYYFVLSGRKLPSFITGLMFSLSYHGFYLPALLLWPVMLGPLLRLKCFHFQDGLLFYLRSIEPRLLKTSLYSVFGTLCGILVHPGFPANIIIGIQHLQIALTGFDVPLNFGNELIPLPTNTFIIESLFTIGVFVLSILKTYQTISNDRALTSKSHLLPIIACLGFGTYLFASFLSPRALEIAAPLSAVLSIYLYRTNHNDRRIRFAILSLVFIQLFFVVKQIDVKSFNLANIKNQISAPISQSTNLEMLPSPFLKSAIAASRSYSDKDSTNFTNVFNCSWDNSPYLLYSRPNTHIVDLLDPSFLYLHSKHLFKLREQISSGETIDLYESLKNVFSTKYVYCQSRSRLIERLKTDVRFRRIYPSDDQKDNTELNLFSVYELLDQAEVSKALQHSFYVSQFEAMQIESKSISKLSPDDPSFKNGIFKRNPETVSDGQLIKTNFIELANLFGPSETDTCYWVKPKIDPEKISREIDLLGIGGGPNLRIWIGTKPLYENNGYELARNLVGLYVPLSASDLEGIKQYGLTALVCERKNSPPGSLAISFWERSEIEAGCSDHQRKSMFQFDQPSNVLCNVPISTKN